MSMSQKIISVAAQLFHAYKQ